MADKKIYLSSKSSKGQAGFSIGSVIMILLLAGAVYGIYRFVRAAQADNARQAEQLSKALTGDDEASESDSEGGSSNRLSTDQSQLWENPIRKLDVKVDTLTATFTIHLPGSYQGTCTLEINQAGSTQKRRFVTEFKSTRTCEIYVPVKELADAKTWQYQAGYFSDDGRTYGKYPAGTLNL